MSEKYIIPTPGDVIAGKYHIEKELGRGAYGVVFRARQVGIDRHVALKTLLPKAFLEADIVKRFEREANFVGRLNHPNIVGVHDYGRHENLLYMSVEYVEGDTLEEIIAEQGALEPERVRKLVYQIVAALEHAHETGIVHRDLKPANIVILEQPGDEPGSQVEVVKVLDFGIAKLIRPEADGDTKEALTEAGTVLGTPHYMSPDSIIGEDVDHRADIYSLGVMIYEMLTGERPFGGKNSPGVMVKHLRDEPPELPAHLAGSCWGDAVRGCMRKVAKKRIQSAVEVRQILERRDEGQSRTSAPGDSTGSARSGAGAIPRLKKRALVPAIVIGVLAAVSIAIGFQWIPLGEDSSQANNASQAKKTAKEAVEKEPLAAEDSTSPEPPAPVGHETMRFGAGDIDTGAKAPIDKVDNTKVGVADQSNTVGLAVDDTPGDVPSDDVPSDDVPSDEVPDQTDQKANPARTKGSSRDKDRPEPKKIAPEQVSFHIETVPSDARVIVAGTPVGASPLDHTLPSGDEPVTIELHHIGYRTKYRTVLPDKDRTLRVTLEKGRLKLIP
jgi:serine/threonine-protein kinase